MIKKQAILMLGVLVGLAAVAAAQDIQKPQVEMDSGSPTGPYLVIDLNPRKSGGRFAVSNLAAAPAGGWSDEYKTTKLVLRRIPAGTFTMGSPADELGRDADESQHAVTLTKDFYIGVFEVTRKQWELVMSKSVRDHYYANLQKSGDEAASHKGELDRRPVEMITFYEIRENPTTDAGDAKQEATEVPSDDPNVDWPANNVVNPNSFFGNLRVRTQLQGLDLPTEAQWEYACRAGTTTTLNSGKNLTRWTECPNLTELGRYMANHDPSEWFWTKGWVRLNSTVVGSYAPNNWGLHDMHGNVWEWCLDWYGPLSAGAVTDPKGPAAGLVRVLRGGGWDERAKACRAANRGTGGSPERKNPAFGFRVALPLP
jgi:formylglycine-generating enzyme required for sulfatase activity